MYAGQRSVAAVGLMAAVRWLRWFQQKVQSDLMALLRNVARLRRCGRRKKGSVVEASSAQLAVSVTCRTY